MPGDRLYGWSRYPSRLALMSGDAPRNPRALRRRRRRQRVVTAVSAVVVLLNAIAAWVVVTSGRPGSAHSSAATASTSALAHRSSAKSAPVSTVPSPASSAAPVPTVPLSSAPAPASPPYATHSWQVTFTDPTRSTPARGSVPASPGRTLRTYMVGPVGATGPLPIVVFAEGYDQTPEAYATLLDAWASAGFLVAAPDLPGLASDLPGSPVETDTSNEALDLGFVVTSILTDDPGGVDPARIAAAGHSDGGMAVVTLGLDPDYLDTRFKAFLVMSSSIPDDVTAGWGSQPYPGDLLVTVGDQDEYANYTTSVQVFDTADMPKALLTVPGGDHLGIYLGSSSTARAVRSATVAYLQTVLARGAGILATARFAGPLTSLPGSSTYTVSTG